MAISKIIIQDNGVPLSYHRISDIKNVINDKTYINVISYVNQEQREREFNQPKYNPFKEKIYSILSTEEVEYNDTLTIQEAYEYLKTLPKYENAEDI